MGKTTEVNLSRLIYGELRELITYGKLSPGQKIIESKLIRHFKTSRTPFREAVKMLEATGFLETFHNRGTYVKEISVAEVKNIYDTLSALEGFAVRLTTESITDKQIEMLEKLNNKLRTLNNLTKRKQYVKKNVEFHSLFSRLSGNDFLGNLIQETRDRVYRYRFAGIAMEGHIQEFISDHEAVLEAVKKRDAKRSEEKMRKHIQRTKYILVEFFREFLL